MITVIQYMYTVFAIMICLSNNSVQKMSQTNKLKLTEYTFWPGALAKVGRLPIAVNTKQRILG